MEAAMQQLTQQMESLQQQFQLQAIELQNERQSRQLLERLVTAVERGSSTQPNSRTMIDTKGLGKPSSFGKGDRKELESMFPSWSRKTRNFVLSIYDDLKDLLDWAAEQPDVITSEKLKATYG